MYQGWMLSTAPFLIHRRTTDCSTPSLRSHLLCATPLDPHVDEGTTEHVVIRQRVPGCGPWPVVEGGRPACLGSGKARQRRPTPTPARPRPPPDSVSPQPEPVPGRPGPTSPRPDPGRP